MEPRNDLNPYWETAKAYTRLPYRIQETKGELWPQLTFNGTLQNYLKSWLQFVELDQHAVERYYSLVSLPNFT